MSKFDLNNPPKFRVPDHFLDRLFEFSGKGDSDKGIMIAYVNEDGCPVIYTKSATRAVEMGLRKAVESYLGQLDGQDQGVELDD